MKTLTFYSKTKTVINEKYFLEDAFNKLINRIDQWTIEGSRWIIDKVEGLHINTANYEPIWCHIRLINPTNNHPERINNKDKEIASALDYSGIDFPMKTHDYELVEERFEMNVNVFCYENKIYPIYISKKSNTQVLNTLLITNEEKSHYVFIKDFDRLMYSKAKTKNQH